MRSLILFLGFGLATTASASPPIIGGALDTGDPAVVMLAGFPADRSTLFTCTAVIISPTAALTAAHCVDHPGFTYGVFFGADASAFSTLAKLEPELAPVSAVHAHPNYSRTPPFNADIAVIEFADPLPSSITPLQIARSQPVPAMVGLDVRIIGYGQTVFGQNNSAKYAATTKIAALDPDDTILIGTAQVRTCVGDSGGPALLDGVVIGIDSYSDTSGCGDPAHFRRTDAYLAFIDQHAGTAPPPPDDELPIDEGGGCNTGGESSVIFGLALLLLLTRRH
ncbi:MAG: S1 family peptidase [Deltaproteobacteria bacterium]|nr:S1 family peptidase [Deltaproteobacteria bacterium]